MNALELLVVHEMLLARAAGVARRLRGNPDCAELPDTFAPEDGATLRMEGEDVVLEWWIGNYGDGQRIQTATSFPATLLDPYSQHLLKAAGMSVAMKRHPIFPLPWRAAWLGAAVAAFAYVLLLKDDWPGHAVIAVVAVYFAVLSLLSNGRRRVNTTS
jgi:hypothetical protein